MLIGREAEQARLASLLDNAGEGRSGVLVVTGEAGVGKTALLDDAAAAAHGMRVLRVLGIESEASVPFGALFDVCRPFLDAIDELPERQRHALQGALAIGPAAAADQFAIGAATLSLLAADAHAAPLLLVMDDAQWLDQASAASLAFAFRRLDADYVAVVIGIRTGTDGGFDATGFPVLELGRLSQADAVALAGTRRPVSRAEAERIAAASDGNPLAILELAGSETSVVGEPVPITAHVEQTFASRIGGLPEDTQAALLVLAVDDLGLVDVIGQATSLAALVPAEAAGLVTMGDGRLTFRHPLVRSAIYQRASPAERRAAHTAIAASLPPEQETRRTWHRAAALIRSDEDVAAALEAIAVDAQQRIGAAAAATTWRRAAELTPDPIARARRWLATAEAAWAAGTSPFAQQAVDHALADCSEPLLRADIVRLRARIASQSGAAAADVEAMLREAAAAVAELDSQRAAYLLADAALAYWPAWDTEPHVELARAARAAAHDLDDPLFDYVLGWELARAGAADEAAVLFEAAATAVLANPARRSDPIALMLAADCVSWRGQPPRSRTLGEEAAARARELGAAGVLVQAFVPLVGTLIDVGAWDQAEAVLAEAAQLAADTGQMTGVGHALSRQAELAARRGDAERFDVLTDAAAEYRRTAAPIDAYARNGRCLLALGAGRPEAAIESREGTERYSVEQLSANALDLIEAYIRAGRLDDARERLDEVSTHVHLDPPLGAYHRCRALIADDYAPLFEEAIRIFMRLGDVFETARTRLAYGERLRRANRRRDARPHLEAALDTFEQLRANAWADRAQNELLASGENRRVRSPENRDLLTPQERHIASLAAEGLTNREIGALLFLSPRTVETHLGRVFRKLGVTSRAALPESIG